MMETYSQILLLFLLFSHSVTSDSETPGLQHARLPCTPPFAGACSDSCLLSQGCHPTISSSVIPFPSCLQSFPASGYFLMSQHFALCGQSIWASVSASVLPMTNQGWFPLGLTGLISLLSNRLSKVFSGTIVWKHQFFYAQPSLWSNTHICTLNPNPWSELTLDNKMNTLILFFDFLSNHLLHLSKVPKCP